MNKECANKTYDERLETVFTCYIINYLYLYFIVYICVVFISSKPDEDKVITKSNAEKIVQSPLIKEKDCEKS